MKKACPKAGLFQCIQQLSAGLSPKNRQAALLEIGGDTPGAPIAPVRLRNGE